MASEGYFHISSKKKASESLTVTVTEKLLPIDTLGLIMMNHSDFGQDSSFGTFLNTNRSKIAISKMQLNFLGRARETGTGPLQSCYVTKSVCVDPSLFYYNFLLNL
jgi:hypothetical protein